MLKQLRRFRVHLIFGGAVTLWLLLGVLPYTLDAQSFIPALWTAIKDIRPMEWVVVLCLLFSIAFPRDRHNPRTTTLGLTGK